MEGLRGKGPVYQCHQHMSTWAPLGLLFCQQPTEERRAVVGNRRRFCKSKIARTPLQCLVAFPPPTYCWQKQERKKANSLQVLLFFAFLPLGMNGTWRARQNPGGPTRVHSKHSKPLGCEHLSTKYTPIPHSEHSIWICWPSLWRGRHRCKNS